MDEYILFLLVIAVISVSSSLAVIITVLIFPHIRNNTYFRIIGIVALGSMIGNVSFVVPIRANKSSWWCSLEAGSSLTGYSMSWIWTTILTYFLYMLAVTGKTPEITYKWIIIGVLLPVAIGIESGFVAPYGPAGKEDFAGYSFSVCTYKKNESAEINRMITYVALLIISFLIMLWLLLKVIILERKKDPSVSTSSFKLAKSMLSWYPLFLALCWLPRLVTDITTYFLPSQYYSLEMASLGAEALKICYGIFSAIIFFAKSPDVKSSWNSEIKKRRLQAKFGNSLRNDETERVTEMNRLSDLPVIPGSEIRNSSSTEDHFSFG